MSFFYEMILVLGDNFLCVYLPTKEKRMKKLGVCNGSLIFFFLGMNNLLVYKISKSGNHFNKIYHFIEIL